MADKPEFDDETEIALQAAAFRALQSHLQQRTDVQNIDLMNLAGFCRNCLSRWVLEAAAKRGVTISKESARAYVYGMDYKEWCSTYQTEATEAQKLIFAQKKYD